MLRRLYYSTAFLCNLICIFLSCEGSFEVKDWSIGLKKLRSEYDFVIVGGGSAGTRLANKLSSNRHFQVLLIEAGSVAPDYTEIPGFSSLAEKSNIDWDYDIVPQEKSFQAFVGKKKHFPKGKVLGGSSVINFILYQRGTRYDYDTWAEKFGCEGWAFDDVLPYFLEDEGNSDMTLDSKMHGRNGSLCVSSTKFVTPVLEAMLEGTKEIGYPVHDILAGNNTGSNHLHTTTCNGVYRCSAAKAFIQPIVGRRPNLHILLETMGTKIIFEGNVAVGVEINHKGIPDKVKARREVILSAGAFRSPQLLMVSGIGPKEELDKFQIPVIADLPVGKNFQDHMAYFGVGGIGPAHSTVDMKDADALIEYFEHGTGPMTGNGCHLGVSYFHTKLAEDNVADVEFLYYSAVNGKNAFPLKPEYFGEYLGPSAGKTLYWALIMLNRPRSAGTITLRSTNALDPPIIDPNYFADPHDLDVMADAARIGRRLFETEAMKKINVTFYDVPFPGCKQYEFWSDEYLHCLPQQMTYTIYHYCGTNRMGDLSRDDVVVGPDLKVKGVERLRVADASVIPQIIAGHLNPVAIMIGSKAGDMILCDHQPASC